MASSSSKNPVQKRVIYRKKPKNENTKAIRDTLNQIRNEDITVHEFATLIGPHTGDKGEALTQVMTDELNAFRKMVSNVYDTMTQDVSDVLANEQIDLARMYSEKIELYKERIRRALTELGRLNPNFDFRLYYKNPQEYITKMFSTVELPDNEEVETAQRHMAYHRLQWLKSEGERLQQENNKLQQRLAELKQDQHRELKDSVRKEVEVEKKNAELEQTQADLQDKLDDLNTSLQKAIVTVEKKQKTGGASSGKRRPAWQDVEIDDFPVRTAVEIESMHVIDEIRNMSPIAPQNVQQIHPEPSTSNQQSSGRRAHGPKDTWSGFQ